MNRKTKKRLPMFIIILISLFAISKISFTEVKIAKLQLENHHLEKVISQTEIQIEQAKKQNQTLLANINDKKNIYKNKMQNEKIAYLTFDDGPSSNTLNILEILKENNVKATFFVNGHESLKHLYKKIVEAGNVLANHTYSHDYRKVYTSPDNFINDIKKLDNFIKETTGQEPSHVIRFPGGSNNTISHRYGGRGIMPLVIDRVNKEGYTYFDWNVDSTDASRFRQTKERIINSVINEAKYQHHAVILMHDLAPKTTTVQALPEIIKILKNQGFTFDVLSKNSPTTHFK